MRKLYALLKNRAPIIKIGKLFVCCVLSVLGFLYFIVTTPSVHAADSWEATVKKDTQTTSFLEHSIALYQKLLSRSDGDRCPMYPSCSAYAKKAFHKHGFIKGWILTSDRLLRCGHDEIRLSGRKMVNGKYVTPDPLNKNDFIYR